MNMPLETEFLQIITIPVVADRMGSMIFRRRLELEATELLPELNVLRNAASELRHSAKLKRVLQVHLTRMIFAQYPCSISPFQFVLAVGNALNASSFRGGARGFKLEALLKV
jgi:hypothetical protein